MRQFWRMLTAAGMLASAVLTVPAEAAESQAANLRVFLCCGDAKPSLSECDMDGSGTFNAIDLALMKRRDLQGTEKADWKLIWQDEFDGNSVDTQKWGYDTGNWLLNENGDLESYGWGNNEKQFYTDQNAIVSDGILTIAAKKEAYADAVQGSYDYTSARMTTKHRFSVCGGRMEIRARVDSGKSLWPAIWMLPEDTVYGKWAASGEIDIMEGWGSKPETLCGTIHFGGTWPDNTYLTENYTFENGDSTSNWHAYSVEWDAQAIRWFVDDTCYSTQTDWYSEGRAFPAPFDQNFYLILNLAVGGNFDGVNGTEADPNIFADGDKVMQVDYVRVYEKADGGMVPSALKSPALTGYFEGADASLRNSDAGTVVTVNSVGTLEYAALAYWAKQPLTQGKKYRISADIASSVPRQMRLTVEDSSYARYLDELIRLSAENQHISYDFDVSSDMAADIKFQLGCFAGDASLPAHTVNISNLKLEQLD